MRRSAIVVVLAALVVLLAPPATAKGPSGVLISDSRRGTAVGVSWSDDRLMELYNLIEDGTDLPRRPRDLGVRRRVSLVWVAGDRYLLRTEQLVLDRSGGGFLVRETDDFPARTTWRRVADPARLTSLLTGLGVLGQQRPVGGAASGAPPSAERTASADPATAEPSAAAGAEEPVVRSLSLDGWRWMLPGLGLGLLVGTLVTRGALRRTKPLRV